MTSPPPSPAAQSPTTQQLLRWCREQHKYDPAAGDYLAINDSASDDERGIVASEAFSLPCPNSLPVINQLLTNNQPSSVAPAVKPLISLPLSMLVTPQLVKRTVLQHIPLQQLQPLTDYQLLSVFIIYHRRLHRHSSYAAYINTLPATYTRVEWLSYNEIERIAQVIDVDVETYRRKVDAIAVEQIAEWQQICKLLQTSSVAGSHDVDVSPLPLTWDGKQFESPQCSTVDVWSQFVTLAEYQYAYGCVSTRSVWMEAESYMKQANAGCSALAPFLDMLNHSADISTISRYSKATKRYELYLHSATALAADIDDLPALQYQQGDEVSISYGQLTNLTLMERYGFCLLHNQHDYLSIPMVSLNSVLNTWSPASKESLVTTLDFASQQVLTDCGLVQCCETVDQSYEFKLYTDAMAWDLSVYVQVIAWQHVRCNQPNARHVAVERATAALLNDEPISTEVNQFSHQLLHHMLEHHHRRLLALQSVKPTQPASYVAQMIETFRQAQLSIVEQHLAKLSSE